MCPIAQPMLKWSVRATEQSTHPCLRTTKFQVDKIPIRKSLPLLAVPIFTVPAADLIIGSNDTVEFA